MSLLSNGLLYIDHCESKRVACSYQPWRVCAGGPREAVTWWHRTPPSLLLQLWIVTAVYRSKAHSVGHLQELSCVCVTVSATGYVLSKGLWVHQNCHMIFCPTSSLCPTGGFACKSGWRSAYNKHHWCCMGGNKWESQSFNEGDFSWFG